MVTPETPLAREPKLSVDSGIAGVNFDLDVPAVSNMMERSGKDPANLGAMAIHVYTDKKAEMGLEAYLAKTPRAIDGHIHYPVIGLRLDDPSSPDLSVLNKRFRHEWRHVMQEPQTIPLYFRPWARNTVRAVSIPLAVLGWKQNIDQLYDNTTNYSVLLAMASIAATPGSLFPRQTMWILMPREIDAEYFAWRNKDFCAYFFGDSRKLISQR